MIFDRSHVMIADDECSCGCAAYAQCDRDGCPHHGPWPYAGLDVDALLAEEQFDQEIPS
jgi:hypothetical protein